MILLCEGQGRLYIVTLKLFNQKDRRIFHSLIKKRNAGYSTAFSQVQITLETKVLERQI